MRESLDSEIRGFMTSRVILTAAELDVFTRLDAEPHSAEELSASLALNARAATRLLDCLVAFDLLRKEQGRYRTTEQGSRLSAANPHSILPSVKHAVRLWNNWNHLTSAVRDGSNPTLNAGVRTLSDEDVQAFIGAMDIAARALAQDISQKYNAGPFQQLLDVGGGSGAYTIAFLQQNPRLRAVIFDRAAVIPIAKENVRQANLQDRVSFVPGDFYVDELPRRCDLVLLSAIIHQNSPGQNLGLFQKIHRALEADGVLLIRDWVMESSRTKPLGGTMFALNMLVSTPNGDTYTFEEIKANLEDAGFGDVELLTAGGGEKMDSLVQARKHESA
ncbi:MAG: methyltransferase [Dehalococcoidia bacterium]|nr:methyltransferase [Dehalococcoidia bacterium]